MKVRFRMFLGILLLLSLVFPLAQTDRNTAVVNAADGVPIHYSVQGKGDTALVFVHCWACDRNVLGQSGRRICEELSRRDYRSSGSWPVGAGKKELVHPEFCRRCQNSCHKVGPQASGACRQLDGWSYFARGCACECPIVSWRLCRSTRC